MVLFQVIITTGLLQCTASSFDCFTYAIFPSIAFPGILRFSKWDRLAYPSNELNKNMASVYLSF